MTPTQAFKLRQLVARFGAQMTIDPSLGTTAALSPAEQIGGELNAFIDECTIDAEAVNPRIVDTLNISQVERRSDQSVLVHFVCSRAASQFERELK